MDELAALLVVVVASGIPFAGLAVAMVAAGRLRRLRRLCLALEERIDALTPTLGPVPKSVVAPAVQEPRPEVVEARAPVQRAPVRTEPAKPAPPVVGRAGRGADRMRRVEQVVGQRWITWIGALAVFVGAAFFLKYAMDRGWIGPAARVLCGGGAGLVMIAVGARFARRSMRALGQGLIGGGLAIVYLSIYAAHAFYNLIPEPVALGLLTVATAGGMLLAVVYDALPISLLASVGGFLTPLLLWTGFEERDTLFTFLAVLDAGVLGVALLRRWRALDAVAQGVTWTYFAVWYQDAGGARDPLATSLWLAAFFALFALVPYARHLRDRAAIASERVAMAFVGTAVTLWHAADLLYDDHRLGLGLFALAVAAVELGLAALVRRRIPDDRRGLLAFAMLAVGAVTAALPGFLEDDLLTAGFAAEGVLLVWLAWRLDYLPVRATALAPIAIAAARVFAVHWPLHGPGEIYTPLFNREFGTAIAFAAAALGYAWIQHRHRSRAAVVDRALTHVAAHGGAFFGMGLVAVEIVTWLETSGQLHLAQALMPLPWIAGSAIYLAWAGRNRSTIVRAHGLAAIVVAAALSTWSYGFGASPPAGGWLVLNWRFAVGLAAAAVLTGFAVERFRRAEVEPDSPIAGAVILGCALGALLTLLSAEVYQFFARRGPDSVLAERAAQTALSVLWSGFAATVLAVGIWLGKRPLRFAALALLGVTAVKLVLVDLAVLREGYRIVSFVVLGLVMLGVSYLYHRLERRLTASAAHRQGG